MTAKQEIIALANRCGIDVDEDGDIMGSTNGALLAFAAEILKHAALAFAASTPTLTTERDAFENWWNAKLAAGEASIDIAFHMFVELTADSAQPQAAEPLIHWRDKPQNIALLAVERGDPVDCDGTFACPICGKDEPHQHTSEEIAKFRMTQPQAAEPKGLTEGPSFANPLAPYGMLVRALRIVAGTTLYDMAQALLTTPAKLSAMEFGRAPVTQEFAFDVSAYFDALGVPNTQQALKAALLAKGE